MLCVCVWHDLRDCICMGPWMAVFACDSMGVWRKAFCMYEGHGECINFWHAIGSWIHDRSSSSNQISEPLTQTQPLVVHLVHPLRLRLLLIKLLVQSRKHEPKP
jgi:hypothetical protein